jgi:hypothetical protein
MGEGIVFNQILHLVGKGYTLKLEKASEFDIPRVLRIELSKGEHHHVELIDISVKTMAVSKVSTDYLISRALSKAEWELDYYIEQEINNG